MKLYDPVDNSNLGAIRAEILLVEDDDAVASAVCGLLDHQYTLYTAASGEEALRLFRTNPDICLILLDYRLPDMSGIEVLLSVKKTRPSVPVIFITAYGSEDIAVQAFISGARDYIKKPFSIAELSAKIEFCLAVSVSSPDAARRTLLLPAPEAEEDQHVRSVTNPNYLKIQKAVRYIRTNYTANISLADVADRACISRFHFSRVFRDVMGITFKKFVVNMKMEKAKEMLADRGLSTSEAADAVGYEEISHFVKTFKKHAGCTPSEYRKSHTPAPTC